MDELLAFSWGDVLNDKEASSRIISAEQLPSFEDMKSKAKIDSKTLKQFQLDNLLWLSRHMGIHDRWQPDFPTGSTFEDISIVCYLDKKDERKWRLYITVSFWEKLAKKALNNFPLNEEIDYTYNKNDELGKILYNDFFYSI